jgi:putative transposase
MRKSRYSDDQIEAAVRQAESGAPIAEIVRKLGVSEATFLVWKKRYNQGLPGDSELSRLRYENAELKRLVIDLIFDRELCKATHVRNDLEADDLEADDPEADDPEADDPDLVSVETAPVMASK